MLTHFTDIYAALGGDELISILSKKNLETRKASWWVLCLQMAKDTIRWWEISKQK